MRCFFRVVLLCLCGFLPLLAEAQPNALFAPFDCRIHAESVYDEPVVEIIKIDSSLLIAEPTEPVFDSLDGWKQWTVAENFSYGKDRGALRMITDLNALHPYFRDKIKELIVLCRKKGIDLAVVETYRTHAKQNEYKVMGRKYTNSMGGKSKHQYGLAADVVPIVDSVAVWDNLALWKKIGITGEKLGLRWGGRWKRPYDPGHFEWTGGLTSYHLSQGELPPIPLERYPSIEEELSLLRKFWKEWEVTQSAMTRR